MSDQRTHFKNQVMEMLRRARGSQHHFTTSYAPWANITVEVVNREVLIAVKSLTSERRLQFQEWPLVLSVAQSALNSMPSDRVGGVAPLATFTGLPATGQLRAILHPQESAQTTIEWVNAEIKEHVAISRTALDNMHREMVDASEKRRRAARERHARRKGVMLQKFEVGDFVLAVTATGRSGNKLALVWRGPKRIVRALSDYTFEVQGLMVPFAPTIRHATRLQLYRKAARGEEQELIEQAIYGEGGHLVEALKSCKLSPATQRWEILVEWFGVDDIEASWEPAETIKKDVPDSTRRSWMRTRVRRSSRICWMPYPKQRSGRWHAYEVVAVRRPRRSCP